MLRLVFSFVAAALLLGGFLVVLGAGRLAHQLAGADAAVFALGLVAVAVALVCWGEAMRRLFVAADAPLSRRRALVAYCVSAFGKQVLPMGNAGGPAIVAYAYDREVTIGYTRSLAVVAVAEFLALAASLVLAVVGIGVLLLFGPAGSTVRWLGVGVVLFAATLGALGAVVWYRRRHVSLAVAGIARLLDPVVRSVSPRLAERLEPERVDAGLQRYYDTFDPMVRNRRAVGYAFALSQIGWVCFALSLYTSALALGVHMPVALALFLVPAAGVATLFPLPGGLGGLEVGLAGLLAALAIVDITTAGAVVILFRLCSFWFLILVGGLATPLAAVSVRELTAPLKAPLSASTDEGPREGETVDGSGGS